MPIAPLITFKAGQCDVDTSSKPYKVTPQPEPGYIYLYSEDELVHFCWRRRDQPLGEPELDLVMIPTDGSFLPYDTSAQPTAKTNGRIFVLRFASSPQRHLFWMQSKPQGRHGDPSLFSRRDRKIGTIIHQLLQGERVNVTIEMAGLRNYDHYSEDDDDEDDEAMEDVQDDGHQDHHVGGSGGAGADATGGDIREGGSREGGADGARAASSSAPDAAAAVRNFLDSLRSQPGLAGGQQQHADIPYPHLNHLLSTSTTIPVIDTFSSEQVDALLSFLPPAITVLASGTVDLGRSDPTADQIKTATESLSLEEKKALLQKVLRSPQFHQALETLTMALRDGGLPSIADALNVGVENGGYLQAGIPMGGGYAVKAFVDGVTKTVRESRR